MSGAKEPSSAQSLTILVIAIVAVVGAAYVLVKRHAPASAAAVAEASSAAAVSAAAEFEIIDADHRFGTSKLYARGDFLPLDDPRAFSEGDFIGRLRALFGAMPGDEYVLRHRKTGFIITAYSAQSGPSYGGGPRRLGPLASVSADASVLPGHDDLLASSQDRARRVAADPVLAKGRPMDALKRPITSLAPGELKELREKDRVWMKHFADVAAPEGFAPVAARLDELVSSVLPVDWETTRYSSDDQIVYRVGVLGGQPFNEELGAAQGIEFLLHQGETTDAGGGPFNPDRRAVQYWLHHAKLGQRVEAALPRVRKAWFRHIAHDRTESKEMRELLLKGAMEEAEALGIARAEAEEALR